MSPRRLTALLFCPLVLIVFGCADHEPAAPAGDPTSSASRDKQGPSGGYRFTSTITASTIEVNKPGQKSRLEADLFLSCEDDACSTLFQRADSGKWPDWTVRLTPEGDGYSGTHGRVGDCPQGGGGYREAFSWSWNGVDDGSLEGTVTQEFTGCDQDGTTSYAVTATPDESLGLPYLPDPAATEAAAALTAYDETVESVYDEFAKCRSFGEGTPRSARCYAAMYRDWEPDIRTLASLLRGSTGSAKGACRTAARRLHLDGLADAVGAAARVYTTEAGNAAVAEITEQHDLLTRVALMCVPPADHAMLGEDGTLAFDIYGAVPPGDG
jgi:hypothetical protein